MPRYTWSIIFSSYISAPPLSAVLLEVMGIQQAASKQVLTVLLEYSINDSRC